MNDIKFVKTNGGLGRQGASEDPISGIVLLLADLGDADLMDASKAAQFVKVASEDSANSLYIAKFTYPEQMSDYGITKQAMNVDTVTAIANDANIRKRASWNVLYYHISEFFRMNPEGTLYVCVRGGGSQVAATDISQLQTFANGSIRQMGLYTPGTTNIAAYQTKAKDLERLHQPVSLLMTVAGKTCTFAANSSSKWVPTYTAVSALALAKLKSSTPADAFVASGRCNLSFVISCDLDGQVIEDLAHFAYYGTLGAALGAVSKAAVNESIAWVSKFPVGLAKPGLISGDAINTISDADLDAVNSNRYLFVRTYSGDAGNYFNDSFTLDVATSDYCYIENERTIDKACRGVYKNLLPWLNSPIKVDAKTGRMDSGFVAFLETTAGCAIEDMEKAGEISGYRAEVDPKQNVLASSHVEVIIRSVPTGTMRNVTVKIGLVQSV